MKKSKKFRVAREGATTDGRKISRDWIEQMAANYDPTVYGARVNLEHLKGILPDSPFRAYGDVLSLQSEEAGGIMYLVAEISPTDDLVAMNQKRQKVYSSIEVNPSFADTGEAYLVGLAVTDDPASLGTEMLQFSASASKSPLAARKASPENLFTAAEEVALEFVEESEDPDTGDTQASLLSRVQALFSKHKKSVNDDNEAFRKDLEETLELCVKRIAATQESSIDQEAFTSVKTDLDDLKSRFSDLVKQLDSTPSSQYRRQKASGQNEAATDC